MKLGAAFGAEASGAFDGCSTLGAEEVGQWKFGTTVLTELARRSHTTAGRTCYGLWIARSAKTCYGGWCEWLSYRWRCIPRWKLWCLLHEIRRHGGGNGTNVELWGGIVLRDLLTLGVQVEFVLCLGAVGFQIRRTACTEVKLVIETAHADSSMAASAEAELGLYLRPGAL